MLGNIKKVTIRGSLSARLLLFTIFFVLIAEVVIYIPSIANYRINWIEQKLAEANIAILVLEAAPDYMVSRMLADELLTSTENYSITRRFSEDDPEALPQALMVVEPYEVSERFDLREVSWMQSVRICLSVPSRKLGWYDRLCGALMEMLCLQRSSFPCCLTRWVA